MLDRFSQFHYMQLNCGFESIKPSSVKQLQSKVNVTRKGEAVHRCAFRVFPDLRVTVKEVFSLFFPALLTADP